MFRLLLFSLLLSGTFLSAAPQPQPFRRPLVFEPNQGQFPPQVEWMARGAGYQVFLTSEGVTMMVREGVATAAKYSTVKMKLTGSRPWKEVTGLEPTGGVSNYLLGNDPKAWRTNVPQYARISTAGVYDGIDLVFYSQGGNLEYDFVVAPGADAKQIRLAFEGQERMRVDQSSGDLVLTTSGGSEVRQIRPKVYQEVGNKRIEVAGGYELLDHGQAAFVLASYDSKRALVIDPTIKFANLFGGTDRNEASAIALDSIGNAYVTGFTDSVDFLTRCISACFPPVNPNPLQHDQPGTDAFVLELSPLGAVQFITYLGGRDYDAGGGIAVDSTGVYITGTTSSVDFPHQTNKRSNDRDVFVTKMLLDGSGIVYTTIVGGSGVDGGNAIAVDPRLHHVYVTGRTTSNNFPNFYHFGGSLQDPYDGGAGDAFVFFLDASGNLAMSVRIPGNGQDTGTGIALDQNGNAWVVGQTCSSDFPIRMPIPQPLYGVERLPYGCAGFVEKWQWMVSSLLFSTYLTGAKAVAVDANNNAFVVGEFIPAYPGDYNPDNTILAAKFDPSGNLLHTQDVGAFRGSNARGNGIALNSAGEVYVTGYYGENEPTVSRGFVAKWSSDLQTNLFSMELAYDADVGIAVRDAVPTFVAPQIYIAATTGAYDPNYPENLRDVSVWRVDENPPQPGTGLQRLRNYSIQTECINIESGVATVGPIQPGWLSAEWNIIAQPAVAGDPPGQFVYWIQNRWKPDEYLNIESGSIQSTPIQPSWLSARWTFELVPGTTVYQIHNVWQRDKYLNIVNGLLTAGPRVMIPAPPSGIGRPTYYWGLETVH